MYVKIISYYIVITKWLCNWWSRWPLLILRSKVKMLWNFLSISRTPYHISRYKVKGQASVNIGKYFLRLKYIEFLSNFVHCHIWRSRDSGTFDFKVAKSTYDKKNSLCRISMRSFAFLLSAMWRSWLFPTLLLGGGLGCRGICVFRIFLILHSISFYNILVPKISLK